MGKRDVVFPAGRQALYDRNRYSPAVRAGGLLFVSGQVGSRGDGSPEPELERQVRRAFDNLLAILDAAGCTFDDVQDVTMFLVDPDAVFAALRAAEPDVMAAKASPQLRPAAPETLDRPTRLPAYQRARKAMRCSSSLMVPIDTLTPAARIRPTLLWVEARLSKLFGSEVRAEAMTGMPDVASSCAIVQPSSAPTIASHRRGNSRFKAMTCRRSAAR